MKVGISRAVLRQIHRHAAQRPESEVCGLLLGEPGFITCARPAENVAPDTACRFEIDPAVLLAAHKAARSGGPSILGHYHSHPNGRAAPSMVDAENAEPGLLWLIVAGDSAGLFEARRNGSIHGRFAAMEFDLR